MKRCVLLSLLLALPISAFADRYIVVTRHPITSVVRPLANDDFSPGPRHQVRGFISINGFAADLDDSDLAALKKSPDVEWIEPVLERHAFDLSPASNVDTIKSGQQVIPYGISLVNAPAVWPVTQGRSLNGGATIRVAVIDTGTRYGESELQRVYKGGHNFKNNTDDPLDDNGHGTHVAGIIAAADNNEGVVGVAPGVELYSLKVLDACGSGSTEDIIAAIDWIIQKKSQIGGNWIANLSLGASTSSMAEQTAFQRGADAGILFVAASGNAYEPANPNPTVSYPARYPTVMSVGAIDSTSTIADFSQRGPDLKVVAPGVDVLSTVVSAEVATDDGRQFGATLPVAESISGQNICLPVPTVSGKFVTCGVGNVSDFPSSVNGKIALIERGGLDPAGTKLTFAAKSKNAKAAGAIGVIVYNNVVSGVTPDLGTVNSPTDMPPFVFISAADGAALRTTPNATLSMLYGYEGYQLMSGTSMASPHAAAVAALAWSVAPDATAATVANAVINTAKDLGDPGVDLVYGHGLVNALDAAKQLNPAAFGNGATPAPQLPSGGRRPGRRGH
jgi:subtilisin family serine protease